MSRASTRNLPRYLSSLENVPDGSDTAVSVQVYGRSDCVVSIALDPPVGIPTLIPRYASRADRRIQQNTNYYNFWMVGNVDRSLPYESYYTYEPDSSKST